MTPFAAVL